MCFSANASFSSAVVLTIIGFAAIQKTKTTSQLTFSFIPFFFAVQQMCEGFIWLSFTDNYFLKWQEGNMYIFLIFAYIVWPVMIPFSILKLEQDIARKKILKMILGLGLLTSIFYGYFLLFYPTSFMELNSHIQYQLHFPSWVLIGGSLSYGVATVIPHFISRAKKVWILGVFLTLSYAITIFYFHDYVISVWGYFAALISVYIYLILKRINLPAVSKPD